MLVNVPSLDLLKAVVTLGHGNIVQAVSTRLPVIMKCTGAECELLTKAGVRWTEWKWEKGKAKLS